MSIQAKYGIQEAFENKSDYVIPTDKLYDGFYAGIYDELVQGQKERIPFEVDIIEQYILRLIPQKEHWSVLDIGCGTGDHVANFYDRTIGKVTGLDKSQAMINKARKKFNDKNISWKIGDALTTDSFAPEQFNVVCFFYFTIYYFPNRIDVFRNCYAWMKPGSVLCIHIVNRQKFDPILDSASPFPAFSLQKYSKKRVTKSNVTFDTFDYQADFNLENENATFTEEFKFKDGTHRKQTHNLLMPTMEEIVKDAESSGFRYRDYTDLKTIGYEYMYLLFFVR
jgi:ubiquinone/menaquinone biosynthesis C-methylase UbiE